MRLMVLVGNICSGKSTVAARLVKDGWREINRDNTRIAVFLGGDRSKYLDYKFSKDKEELVTTLCAETARNALKLGLNVVVSDTNLDEKYRAKWKELALEFKAEYVEKPLDVPLDTCKKRNFKRDVTIPLKVVYAMEKKMREYLGKPTYIPDTGKPTAIICDLDGTLFHNTSRGIFEFDKVDTDTTDPAVLDILTSCKHKIIFLSGRNDSCYDLSGKAIEALGLKYEHLILRTTGDRRPDYIVKEEMFWKVAKDYNILYALDDRDQVVDLWRSIGIKTLQVSYGDF